MRSVGLWPFEKKNDSFNVELTKEKIYMEEKKKNTEDQLLHHLLFNKCKPDIYLEEKKLSKLVQRW